MKLFFHDVLVALGLASATPPVTPRRRPPATPVAPATTTPPVATPAAAATTATPAGRGHKSSWLGVVIGILVLIAIVGGVSWWLLSARNTAGGVEGASPSPTTAKKTWRMGNTADGPWVSGGIDRIKNAKNRKEAEKAAQVWVNLIKRDPNLLIGAYAYLIPKGKSVKASALVDKKGWATVKAVQLVTEIRIALGRSRITPSLAPSNGVNSGVAGGRVVAAATGGISGDRRAILIVLPSGKKVWVMSRCGNPVTIGRPYLAPKEWWRDPYPQGHAPIGGGENEDPGPGPYVPPEDMPSPPPTPYTPPPSPTATPTATPTPPPSPTTVPTVAPTPTPTQTATPTPEPSSTWTPPPPEPGAPDPEDPAGPGPPPPGITR